MNDGMKPFEVLSVGEMRKRFYLPSEESPVSKLNAENVPEPLRCLIPMAERWGISDDILRLHMLRNVSSEEVQYLKEIVAKFDDVLDEWLAGPEANSANPTHEYLSFSCMRMAADGC